jgi:opacity protein-like surface antigen
MKVMRKVSSLAAGAAIVAFAGVGLAQADGGPGGRVAYQKPWDWGGLYFGVHSGYQWSSVNVENPFFPPGFSFDHDSFVVGGHIGVQHQFGQIVLGVEGNLTTTFQNNPGVQTCFAPGPQLTPGGLGNCSARLDDILTVGPRLGFAAGKWMPYVTGGYANGAYHFIGRTIGTQIQNEEARARVGGWFVGGGVEMALSHGWTIGLDYRHYDFDDKIRPAFTPAGTFLEPARFYDGTADVFTARVSWKLGRPEAVVPLK